MPLCCIHHRQIQIVLAQQRERLPLGAVDLLWLAATVQQTADPGRETL